MAESNTPDGRGPMPGQDETPVGEILAAAERARAVSASLQVYGAPTRERVVAVYVEQPSTAWQRIFVDPYQPGCWGSSYGAGEVHGISWMPSFQGDYHIAA
ncbi:MAG: hypothetical protein U0231_08905 [Nitrospiraceae bacterium]